MNPNSSKQSTRTSHIRSRRVVLTALATSALLAFAFATPARAQDSETSPDKRLQNSTDSITEVMNAPDKGIPRSLYNKARCVVIIPDVLKAAFIVGGKPKVAPPLSCATLVR